MIQGKKNFIIFILILFVSFSANYYYGSIGVFPIDSFAFYDSANLINKGFLPIRDFWSSNGFFVDLVQSFFFNIFGVNWKIYLLHSSLLNFLFSWVTYKFLIHEGLDIKNSLFYSLSASLLAYPTVGVPFSDHHSLFLSIIALYLFVFYIKKNSKILLFLIPIVLFLAFLSKQVPAIFFIIYITIYLIFYSTIKKKFSLLLPAIFSTIFTIIFFLIFLFINDIGIKNFFIQYIFFPLTIGIDRQSNINFGNFLLKFINEYKFFLVIGSILIFQMINEIKKKSFNSDKLLQSNFVFLLVIFIVILNQTLMKNQNIIFFLLPILIALAQVRIKSYDNKNIFIFLFIILNVFVTLKYHERFNVDRKFMDLENINKSTFIKSEKISNNLKGLKWITVEYQNNSKREIQLLEETINFLKDNKNKSFIISNYQFILTEINHDIYSPNRWYTNDGVSFPLEKNKYRKEYKEFFKDKIIKNDIKKIFTIYPLNEKAFDFVLDKNCFKTSKINNILVKHDLLNCFEN